MNKVILILTIFMVLSSLAFSAEISNNIQNSTPVQKGLVNHTINDDNININAFAENVQYISEYVEDGSVMPYLLIKPKDLNINEKLPMLVFLHGTGEIGVGEDILKKSSFPKIMLKNKLDTPEKFRGYIILPHLNSDNWDNEKTENNLRILIKSFNSTHNVDIENIAIAGHSLGGAGAVYMAIHMDDIFKKAVVFSVYEITDMDISSVKIPLIGIVGSFFKDTKSYRYMTRDFSNVFGKNNIYKVNALHINVPGTALLSIKSTDGKRPFVFDWLFGN